MSILAKWDVGAHTATGVIGVTDEESQWAAFMAYLTTNGVLFVPSPEFQTPAEPGLYCHQQPDKSYTIFQAIATPGWNVKEWGPAQIYVTEVAYLSWILVPLK
jgi:hypothetical protein